MRRQGPDQEGGRGGSGGEAGLRLAGLVEKRREGCWVVRSREGETIPALWLLASGRNERKIRERVMHSAIGVLMGRHTGLDGPR